ncbi:MAG: EamA family transporter [Candidatus Bathyarchaeia archaeon]
MKLPKQSSERSAIVLLLITNILWGSSFVSVKIGLAYVNAYSFAFLRLALASAILLTALILCGRFNLKSIREPFVWMLGLLNGLGFSLQYVGQIFTTPAKTALLVDVNVVVVAIISWRMFNETFGLRKQLAVVLSVVGAIMITTNGDFSTLSQGELLGDALVFLAGLAWALFIICNKRLLLRADRNVIELSTFVLFTTALLLLPMALLFGNLSSSAVPLEGWVWVAYTAIVCTIVPYALWIAALKQVTATISSVVGMLEIVAAMVLSGLVLGETYNTVTLLGAGLVFASILFVTES